MDQVQLETFQAVVEQGSFEGAARVLHVTPSAVSQRIKALERAIGQVLVRRAKPCTATVAGEALIRFAGQVALLEKEALDQARGGTRVSIVVNADSLNTWFLPVLTQVPAATFEIHTDDQDYTADLLRSGTAMAAVTAENVAVQGCRVERLGAMRYLAIAAPGLSFESAPMIVYNRKDQLQHRFLAMVGRRPPERIHYVPAAAAFNEAIRIGLGWGTVPEQNAEPLLASGQYVQIFPGEHLDIPLYWQYWRIESALLNELTAAVRTAAVTALR
ncbi:putative transcriptional regulator, LysR family protein [Actinoplanes ianthinogenes]|uniref:Transcriptional regulator, LysR family protein n=1 Tax=Actinoplanes ianthinogenes TaxID=122358 RepID=A0ABM7LU62_9ACTN|nr:putative transcriptional regulator, LysR family protein [Actinoplanes ianthinogenes]GGQ91989.1 putative transcriptional regulator, LysR family protein [Actinoplanes ianthinogenes]